MRPGAAPCLARLSTVSCAPSDWLIACASFATMSFGVADGTKMPYQYSPSYPGTPASITVGASGSVLARDADETATGFTRLERIIDMAAGRVENIAWARPAATSVSAGGAPL